MRANFPFLCWQVKFIEQIFKTVCTEQSAVQIVSNIKNWIKLGHWLGKGGYSNVTLRKNQITFEKGVFLCLDLKDAILGAFLTSGGRWLLLFPYLIFVLILKSNCIFMASPGISERLRPDTAGSKRCSAEGWDFCFIARGYSCTWWRLWTDYSHQCSQHGFFFYFYFSQEHKHKPVGLSSTFFDLPLMFWLYHGFDWNNSVLLVPTS